MRNLILFDDESRDHLLPLTFTRPVSELRVGIRTIREKWEQGLHGSASWITSDYLTEKYPIVIAEDNLVINGSVLPNAQLLKLVSELNINEALMTDGDLVAARIPGDEFDALIDGSFGDEIAGYSLRETPVRRVTRPWELFTYCGQEILEDYRLLTRDRSSRPLPPDNQRIGTGPVFMEEGASVHCSVLNTTEGPIYIGRDAVVMEGSLLRGPLAIGEGAVLKMGTKVYGPSSFGPHCKVGGEVKNSVMMGYSNKGHEGFLGNSVIGEWCNIGADTNTSNLKNTYSEVRLWNYALGRFERTGQQFCGLIMGDHSKCGINTMFNTGTVAGVSANIFGAGYTRNFIPSFSWGGPKGMSTYSLDKALATAETVMTRRGIALTEADRRLMAAILERTAEYRSWERG
ncbi:MAG: GlmU family protein [Saprospiraceae bacterium]|nr:GlmU family protein [Saprospiraceae bacterium]